MENLKHFDEDSIEKAIDYLAESDTILKAALESGNLGSEKILEMANVKLVKANIGPYIDNMVNILMMNHENVSVITMLSTMLLTNIEIRSLFFGGSSITIPDEAKEIYSYDKMYIYIKACKNPEFVDKIRSYPGYYWRNELWIEIYPKFRLEQIQAITALVNSCY